MWRVSRTVVSFHTLGRTRNQALTGRQRGGEGRGGEEEEWEQMVMYTVEFEKHAYIREHYTSV